jgi:NAD(P)-dependent dehydrogenase (short-subunit alcohol dehydrogenase family)
MRFADDVCVVTGAGAGIGHTTASRFAAEGARVACVDIDGEAAAATAERIGSNGGEARAYTCDVSDDAGVAETFERVEAEFAEPISILFANAGVEGPIVPFGEISVEDWDRVFAINVRGPFLCSKHALPSMRRKGRGAIVITGSNSSFIAFPGWAAYTATKGAVLMLVKSLAVDLEPEGIRVNAICPGPTDTPMYRRGHSSMSEAAFEAGAGGEAPDGLANVVLFAASQDASMMTGSALVADFGNTARGGPTWPSRHYWTV